MTRSSASNAALDISPPVHVAAVADAVRAHRPADHRLRARRRLQLERGHPDAASDTAHILKNPERLARLLTRYRSFVASLGVFVVVVLHALLPRPEGQRACSSNPPPPPPPTATG